MRPRGRGDRRPHQPARTAAPAARGSLSALRNRLTELIEPVTRQAGFDLERVRVARIGRRHSVQVVVDRDAGVGLDAIAKVSHAVSAALDAAEAAGTAVVPGEYVLEVSSPGVDRPLTEPRHWRRNLGRLVAVTGPAGERITGRITAVTETAVVLEVAGVARELTHDQLGPGQVQVELQSRLETDADDEVDAYYEDADDDGTDDDGDDDGEGEAR